MSQEITPDDVLWLGRGGTVVCYYRIALPAMTLGCPWVGATPSEGGDQLLASAGLNEMPEPTDFKVVVCQEPDSQKWYTELKRWKEAGVTIIYEIDDYLEGVYHVKDHPHWYKFGKEKIKWVHACMELADAITVTTPFLAEQYSRFAPTYECPNALDLERYNVTIPARDTLNIGWAGGIAHKNILTPWAQAVDQVMEEFGNVTFVTIGEKLEYFAQDHPERYLAVPFGPLETYPAAMTLFDIALAPAGRQDFFRGKSDLRFLEAGAIGLPVIGDPFTYPTITDGITGLHADDADTVYECLVGLLEDPEMRQWLGENAREYVEQHRSIDKCVDNWVHVLEGVTE